MRNRSRWTVLFSAVVAGATVYYSGTVMATPASGFAGTTLARGRFDDIGAFNHVAPPDSTDGGVWLSWQKTKGLSDLYVQSNVWQPGGSTGWHTHPGHSLIIVTEGTVTVYEGGDPDCTPHVYTQGMGFVDPGAGHVHIIRNEGPVVAKTTAVQLIQAGATRRVDAAAPANCPF